jgi:hypothetical protein
MHSSSLCYTSATLSKVCRNFPQADWNNRCRPEPTISVPIHHNDAADAIWSQQLVHRVR